MRMSVPSRILAIVAVAAGAFVTLAPAVAETRLFNVRTDSPGVTVVGASREGQPLLVAGQNGDTTFFRLDNPAGPVPCSNSLQFSLSDGQVTGHTADLCAANWSITIPVAGAPPVTKTSATMAVATDDPAVTIQSVFLHGQEVTILARQDPYVQVALDSDPQGFSCTRDLGLALSDGRRIARNVDICDSNFVVVVPLVGGAGPGAPPTRLTPKPEMVQTPTEPLPPPSGAPGPQNVPPAQPEQPQMAEAMQWIFDQTPEAATLAYAIPNTDGAEFAAVCPPQSRRTTVTLGRSAGVPTGSTVSVRFNAGAFDKTFPATASEVSEIDGMAHPVLQIPISDALWAALIRERALTIQIGNDPAYSLSLAGSSAKAKSFLSACSPPVQPVTSGPPVFQPGPPIAGGIACNDGSTIAVAVSGNSAVVNEPGRPPVVLFQTRSFVGERYVSGLSEMIAQGPTIYWTREGQPQRVCSP